ncbi:MAG: DUF4435 domain-containing protein [Bacteroidetes bacterium]|nr:MAG: DUF4435 domain-containing protein [Bacteroidota bacterium]
MQPTTLLDNLNSELLAAFSALLPKGSPQRVLVYVESDDDISFWRGILTPFEKKGIHFEINLPIRNNAEKKGKVAVLEFANNVGNNLILCVDSDYDYLLQGVTPTSVLINENKFIFQTYAYSIENLLCYANSLHNICTQATKNDTRIIDLEELIKLYSKIVYQLFLWSIYFAKKGDTNSFTITNFCDTIKILEKPVISEQFSTTLQALKNRVDEKIKQLEDSFSNDRLHVKALEENLKLLGIEQTNTYLFVQGHTIKENVVLMFLKQVFDDLKYKKENQIKTNAKHKTELKNQLDYYKNQIIPIELVLNNNTEYKSCFLYKKIHQDLERYVSNLESI